MEENFQQTAQERGAFSVPKLSELNKLKKKSPCNGSTF